MSFRLYGTISGCGRSSGAVIPALGSGRYSPGPNIVLPSWLKGSDPNFTITVFWGQPGALATVSVKAGVVQIEAQGILPIHTAPDSIGRLPIGEPFHILHHDDQRQAPGGDFHGAAFGRIEIGKELIRIERAKLGAEVHREIAFGKGGPHCSRGHIWN